MEKLQSDLREFIELLNSHEVRYLIVGGYAVAYHGHPRFTGDIEFFIEASSENASKLMAVLNDFGFGGIGLKASDFDRPDQIVQLGYPPNRIDLITSLSGATFADAWEKRIIDELDGVPVNFIDKRTLLANKASTGRLKDKADLDALS